MFVEARERPLRPAISFVVIGWRMPRQLGNTIHSLSPEHQKNVRAEDYEVVVIENHSTDILGAEAATALATHVSYVLREESHPGPVFALTEGLTRARAPYVGVLLDGAHLVTPRLVEFAKVAL